MVILFSCWAFPKPVALPKPVGACWPWIGPCSRLYELKSGWKKIIEYKFKNKANYNETYKAENSSKILGPHFDSICFIRIRSKNWDIFEKVQTWNWRVAHLMAAKATSPDTTAATTWGKTCTTITARKSRLFCKLQRFFNHISIFRTNSNGTYRIKKEMRF